MSAQLEALRRKRLTVFLASLLYFAALLAVGVLVFLRGVSGTPALALAAVCVAAYLLAVRPLVSRYKGELRGAILANSAGRRLTNYRHEPKSGLPREALEETGLVPVPLAALHSREHILGMAGMAEAELADVAFPIREDGRNAMFNGCCIRLRRPGARFAPLRVEAGNLEKLQATPQQKALLEKLGEAIPGSLYLRMEGERLDILLRGRFLGFPVNPLMAVTERTLAADPLPELEAAIRLAQLS